jgi:hypothetical protein
MNIRNSTNSSFCIILTRCPDMYRDIQILSLIFTDNRDVIFCVYLRSDLHLSVFADRSLLR